MECYFLTTKVVPIYHVHSNMKLCSPCFVHLCGLCVEPEMVGIIVTVVFVFVIVAYEIIATDASYVVGITFFQLWRYVHCLKTG